MIEIAKILKPHGIRGEIKTQLFSDNFDAFCNRGFAYIGKDGAHRRITYTVARISPPYVYLRIDGIHTRNDAEELQGVFLYLDRSDFDTPGDDEYYVCDLIGLTVVGENGNQLGTLREVLQHGAADVYVVSGENGFMFPALKRVIEKIDIKNGVLEINSEALKEVAVYDHV